MGVADSVAALERGGMYAMQMNTLSRLRTRSRDRRRSMVSTSSLSTHLGVLNILLKNRSSADSEVIEGGKDRGGERNGVTVMVSCLLLVSCPDLFWKNREEIW